MDGGLFSMSLKLIRRESCFLEVRIINLILIHPKSSMDNCFCSFIQSSLFCMYVEAKGNSSKINSYKKSNMEKLCCDCSKKIKRVISIIRDSMEGQVFCFYSPLPLRIISSLFPYTLSKNQVKNDLHPTT